MSQSNKNQVSKARIIDLNRVLDYDVPTQLHKDEQGQYFEIWSMLIKTGPQLQDLIELNFKAYSGSGLELENQLKLGSRGYLKLAEVNIVSSVYFSSVDLKQGKREL